MARKSYTYNLETEISDCCQAAVTGTTGGIACKKCYHLVHGYIPCDHVGQPRAERIRNGYLGDVPKGQVDILCAGCGAEIETCDDCGAEVTYGFGTDEMYHHVDPLAPDCFLIHDRRNADRARLVAEGKAKNEAARAARLADKHGVIEP